MNKDEIKKERRELESNITKLVVEFCSKHKNLEVSIDVRNSYQKYNNDEIEWVTTKSEIEVTEKY